MNFFLFISFRTDLLSTCSNYFCFRGFQLYKQCFTTKLCSKSCALSPSSPPDQVGKSLVSPIGSRPSLIKLHNSAKFAIYRIKMHETLNFFEFFVVVILLVLEGAKRCATYKCIWHFLQPWCSRGTGWSLIDF